MNDEFEKCLQKHSEALKKAMKLPENDIKLITKKESKVMEEKTRKSVFIRRMGLGAAGVLAALVLCINCVPGIAYASREIPVIGDIVRVVTFGRFEVDKNEIDVNVVVPQIEGLLNKELEDKLNNEFKENANSVITAIEKDIKDLEKEFGEDFRLGVDASYIIRTDNEEILALDTYIVNTVASSSTRHSFYNISKKTGELIELKSLFKNNADYVSVISEYITTEMKKQNEKGEGAYWIGSESDFPGFEKIKENQNFFINGTDNIVICFDKYEVAPGAYGCPEFEIPKEVIKNILK